MTSPGRTGGVSLPAWSAVAWRRTSRSIRIGAPAGAVCPGPDEVEPPTGTNSTTRPASLVGPPAAQTRPESVARGRVRGQRPGRPTLPDAATTPPRPPANGTPDRGT